jgi:hypothetical protein
VVIVWTTSTPVAVVTRITFRSLSAKNRYGKLNAVTVASPTVLVRLTVELIVMVLSFVQ